MRRIVFQVIILVLFLFLTVFASVWFEDTSSDDTTEVKKAQSITWISQAFQKTWYLINGLAGIADGESGFNNNLAEQNSLSEAYTHKIEKINNISQNIDNFSNSPIIEEFDSNSNFSEFLGNFLNKAPSLYFDTKVYSNGWRNFWSLYWLEYKNFEPKQN